MNTILNDSYILIKPSKEMCKIIRELKIKGDAPPRIESIYYKRKLKEVETKSDNNLVSTSEDFAFIDSLSSKLKDVEMLPTKIQTFSPKNPNEGYLKVEDLLWLNKELENQRNNGKKIYLHELLKDCSVFVPQNETIERNPELQKRCEYLKNQQDNLRYKSMTKNVDSIRLREPEETISYQLKQINKQLIAVGQFIISVVAGFAFGFIGVELLVGNLDFGFRLLLGIMCALTIALAELYFLAKQLVD